MRTAVVGTPGAAIQIACGAIGLMMIAVVIANQIVGWSQESFLNVAVASGLERFAELLVVASLVLMVIRFRLKRQVPQQRADLRRATDREWARAAQRRGDHRG